MKVTAVPAQVMTVEDRIAGNLGLNQLLLLSGPIFGCSLLYAILPPFMELSAIKLFIFLFLTLTCSTLSIRIKGRLVLFWLMIITRFIIRPRYYVYDKRSYISRSEYSTNIKDMQVIKDTPVKDRPTRMRFSIGDLMDLQNILDDPKLSWRFEKSKGRLHVFFDEIS